MFQASLAASDRAARSAGLCRRGPIPRNTRALSLVSSSFGLGTVIGPAVAPFFILPFVGLSGPLLVFALIGLLVLVMLRWRLPDDMPRFAARGAIVAYPTAAGSTASATEEEESDSDPADEAPGSPALDRQSAAMAARGFVRRTGQAMMLNYRFLILDRLVATAPPRRRGDDGHRLMAGAFATLLAQWG